MLSEPSLIKVCDKQQKRETIVKQITLRGQRNRKVSTILFVIQMFCKSYLKGVYYQTFILYMYIDIDKTYDGRCAAFRKLYDEVKTGIYKMAKKGYKKTKGPFNPYLIHFLAHTLLYPEGGCRYENIDDVEYEINSLYRNNRIPPDLLPPLVYMLLDTKKLEMDDIAFKIAQPGHCNMLSAYQCRTYEKTWVKRVAPYVSDAMREQNQKNKQISR